jgi:hypothetical protein
MSGQWRYSFGGKEALDYTPLFMRMDRMEIDTKTWNELFADIRHVESAAIDQMRKPA